MRRLADRLRTVLRDRPWPFHPLLFAAYFVLFLYSVNLDEVELGDVLPVLAAVVGGTAAVLFLASLLVGDARCVALVLTAAVIAFLAYGHAARLLQPLRIGPTIHVVGWLAIIALAVIVAWRGRRHLGTITRVLNVASLALVIVPLASIIPYDVGRLTTGDRPTPAPSAAVASPSAATPDIYWFIFDRYPSANSARLAYGIENPIFDELRTRGFYIANDSHANYQRTSASLQATFSAEFLNGRGHADIFGPTDRSGAYTRIQNSNIARFLKTRGYYYVHVGSDFSGTRRSVLADVNHAFDNQTDFDAAFIDSTAVPGILRRTGISGPRWARRYAWTTWEADLLANLPRYPSPKFVFSHLLLPHTPYIFAADGSFVTDEANRDRPRKEQFTEQLAFTNDRMLAIIDDLLAVPAAERPLIIVQADEGPYPSYLEDQTRYDWTTATLEEREIKFGILNAWYVPDGRDIGLYPEVSPVNTFRLLFNAYFDTDLPILPDESFTLDHPEPLEFPDR
jgi:hypothetical protein